MNDNRTTVWADEGFYELTPASIAKGAAILGETTILFSPISRYFAPTSYDRAIDLKEWLETGKGVHVADEKEAAYCLAIQAEITCPFQPSCHEPFILRE